MRDHSGDVNPRPPRRTRVNALFTTVVAGRGSGSGGATMRTEAGITTTLQSQLAELRSRARAPGRLAGELEALRRAAAAHGLSAATPVIHAIDGALARGERGAMVDGLLALLDDALGCDQSPAAHQTIAAVCSVRLSG